MSIQAEIRKTYGDFKLDIKLDSSSKGLVSWELPAAEKA